MRLWPCATARANKTIGKRLTLSFPKAIDQRVIVLALPSEGHLAFGVESAGEQHELIMEVFDEASLDDKRAVETLAVFESREEAIKALNKIRRALARPLRRALGWALSLFLFALVIQWAVSFATTPSQQQPRPTGAAYSATQPTQSQGLLTPEQITALQQSMVSRQGLAGGAPAPAPEAAPTAPPPAEGQGAAVYQNPAQPQDPTGGVLNQLGNSR